MTLAGTLNRVQDARVRARVVLLLVVLALSAVVLGQPAGAATGEGSPSLGRVCASYLEGWTLWDSVPSQNFEPSMDPFDSVAADDLEVSRKCRARVVQVFGHIGGAGQPDSHTVTFYRDDGGRPGRVLRTETVLGEFSHGDGWEITLDRAMRLRPERRYWLSVQINMDFQPDGTWSWSLRDVVAGAPAVWQNPGDGFMTGCTDWTPIAACIPDQPKADLVFEIRTG